MDACRTALDAGRDCLAARTGAPAPKSSRDLLAFARCVRNHGISNFPDPNSQGGFNLAGTGINSHSSPGELAAARTCLPTAQAPLASPRAPVQATAANDSDTRR